MGLSSSTSMGISIQQYSSVAKPAVESATTLLSKCAIYGGSGALGAITYQAIGDGAALAREKKTMEEVFCKANALSYATNALLATVVAGTVGAIFHGSSSEATISDEAVGLQPTCKKRFGQQLQKLLGKFGFKSQALKDIQEQCGYHLLELMEQLGIGEVQALSLIQDAQEASLLTVPAILVGFVGDRKVDRFTCTPTACAKRQPRYMAVARGAYTEIKRAPMNDLAGAPRNKSKVASPLTPDLCLEAYTQETPLYRNANAALRLDDESLMQYAAFVWHTKEGIKKRGRQHGFHKGFVWRGARLDDDHLEFYQIGRKFLWASFTSTSSDTDVALDFFADSDSQAANVLFEIECDGEGCTYCVDISRISKFPHEKEVLFLPYSGFVVKDRSVVRGKVVISLKIVDTLIVEEASLEQVRDRVRFEKHTPASHAANQSSSHPTSSRAVGKQIARIFGSYMCCSA